MVTRARTTFQKRQKEMARKEKRQMKLERRAQRKLAHEGGAMSEETISPSELKPQSGSRFSLVRARPILFNGWRESKDPWFR